MVNILSSGTCSWFILVVCCFPLLFINKYLATKFHSDLVCIKINISRVQWVWTCGSKDKYTRSAHGSHLSKHASKHYS
ncbi:hypothetical protein QVD17_20906 [Tagetes erecta]|uniref:Uncharacterized protein n=1 Tax=Tagetes erecta TaxID=13708 RepID=A0AAD8NYE0_TARER|nr:hypothetical protein QVD17_20906 [Tagetes erecta]